MNWMEARDAARHPTMNRAARTAKNYLAKHVSNAEAEKPCPRSQHREHWALSVVTGPQWVDDTEKEEVAGTAQNTKIVVREVGTIKVKRKKDHV